MQHPSPLAERPLQAFMSPNPVIVDRAATLDQALGLLERYGIRHLPVVECNRVLGMLSDRDLRLATGLFEGALRLRDRDGRAIAGPERVGDVMRQPVYSLPPEARLLDALDCMLGHGIGALPVVERDCLCGLLTETDVLRSYAELRGELGSAAPAALAARPLGTIAAEATLAEAFGELGRHDQHLGILTGGTLTGLISDRDVSVGLARAAILATRAESEGRSVRLQPCVRDVMTTRVVTVGPETPLWRCAGRMLDHKISALPVLADGEVHGLLTQHGIFEALRTALRAEAPVP
jgi:acetoin utilization protein AcuB